MAIRKIAVIGGGASAALLLAHLSRRPHHHDVSVDIYDRAGRFARGVAYSTRHDCHLLNVRATNMSAFHDDKDHFVRWAAAGGYGPSDFVPRKRYGDYLQEVMTEAAHEMPVRFVEQDVISSMPDDQGYRLRTDAGDAGLYDSVVLASGNVRPLRPRVEDGVDGYCDDPWTADFGMFLNARRIALVGSGLTAVDMVLALREKGYSGEIMIVSRNSLLPAPHVDPVPFEAFLSEFDERQSPLYLLHKIRQTVRASGKPWQAVIDSMRPHTNTIWQNWTDAQRQIFSRRLLTFWNVHRHRMAPQIAQSVQAMLSSGQLRMIRGAVMSVAAGPVVNLSNGDSHRVDSVINCLGYRYDERGDDLAVRHRLGPARFGALFETTAIPEIRSQAYDLAQELVP